MRHFFLLFPFFLFNLLWAQPAQKNLSLVSNLTYSYELNDVWAYVDSSGTEYALVGGVQGTSIVSLADPANPQELFFIPGQPSTWRDLKVHEHHAYVSNEEGGGTLIIDLSSLPDTIAFKDTVMAGHQTTHNLWIEDGFLYLVGNDANPGMTIFDLNPNPWNPVLTGSYTLAYVHDVYVRNDTAYLAEVNDGRLTIVDLKDKSQPQVIGQITYPGGFTHNTWLNDQGNICFTTDEYGGAYVRSWDVSDPSDLQEIGRFRSPLSRELASPHNVHVLNDYIVTSYYSDGVVTIDGSRPQNLVVTGYYDTSPLVGSGFDGCWGAYPFLPSGLVLATDRQTGLFVLEPDYRRAAWLEGQVTESGTNNPINGASIEILGTGIQSSSGADGSYATGQPETGQFDVRIFKYGYEEEIRQVTLSAGQLTLLDVELTPSTLVDLTVYLLDEKTQQPIPEGFLNLSQPGFEAEYQADTAGMIYIDQLLTGSYQAIGGKWGYRNVERKVDPGRKAIDTLYLQTGYYDDFTFDFGWFVQPGAVDGNWERDQPKGTFVNGFVINPDIDAPEDLGRKAYITNNDDSSPFQGTVVGGPTVLTSPLMNLSDYEDPVVFFDWWVSNIGSGPNVPDDSITVSFFLNGNLVEVLRGGGFYNDWHRDSVRLLDYGPINPNFYIQVSAEEGGNPHLLEAGFDNFFVVDKASSISTSVQDDLLNQSWRVYPNPARDRVILEAPDDRKGYTVEIYDLQGGLMQAQSLKGALHTLELNRIPSGLYILRLEHDGNLIGIRKLVRQ